MKSQSVSEILGAWLEPKFESGLISRLRDSWNVPISELTNEMLATFLRQGIALHAILPEARQRLASFIDDNSELYEGELASAVQEAQGGD